MNRIALSLLALVSTTGAAMAANPVSPPAAAPASHKSQRPAIQRDGDGRRDAIERLDRLRIILPQDGAVDGDAGGAGKGRAVLEDGEAAVDRRRALVGVGGMVCSEHGAG